MSLLATKSWNPRSAKNRARVERDERQAKEAQNLSETKARSMDAEWRYTHLKATAQGNDSDQTLSDPVRGASDAHKADAEQLTSTAPSEPSARAISSKKTTSDGVPLGGTHRTLKPWYEYDDYAPKPRQESDPVVRRDTKRMDPMTAMARVEAHDKASSSRRPALVENKTRESPFDGASEKQAKLQLLREERLRREREERERVRKLLHKPIYAPKRPENRRYGPVRGED